MCAHKWKTTSERQIQGYLHVWQECLKCREVRHVTDAPKIEERKTEINDYGYGW